MKQKWYPIISKGHMARLLEKQDILTWLAPYEVPKEATQAMKEDILEFVNRACRAVLLKKAKETKE